MDATRELTPPGARTPPPASSCPACGAAAGPLPSVRVFHLEAAELRRCPSCAAPYAVLEATVRGLRLCEGCDLPFLEDSADDAPPRCAVCRAGSVPRPEVDRTLVAATESELQAAVSRAWRFVGAPSLDAYLDRLCRQVARRIEGAPEAPRVVLFDDPDVRSIALPSGVLLVSTGWLAHVEDEAELAFALGHELGHRAGGDTGVRLVRMGMQALARSRRDAAATSWIEAAGDLCRLGCGRTRELAADVRAFAALVELAYDHGAVQRYLERLGRRIEEGEPTLADFALAHPPAAARLQHLDEVWHGRSIEPRTGRINREVFRRAAGHTVLAAGLSDRRPFEDDVAGRRTPRAWRRVAWTAVGIALLAALFLLVGLALRTSA